MDGRMQELLEQSGLWARRSEPVKTWSRGMKQKLAIARALLHRPALVLLDEPTAGLDVAAAVEVRQNLAALAAEHRATVLLTTHNMNEAEKLCSLVAVIRAGRLVEILPEHAVAGPAVHAVCLPAQRSTPRVRAFIDFLAECFERSFESG